MEAPVYNQEGKEAGKVTIPESVFNAPFNADLVHQVVVSMQSNARTPIAHTKGRADVRGGGKKPWQQKGTGRARHGSSRSPIWRGGGVTFGPTNEKNFSKKINRKMRTKALFAVLSQKLKDGELLFVDTLSFEGPKAAKAKEILTHLAGVPGYEGLATKRKNAALVAFGVKNDSAEKSFSNFGNVSVEDARNLNPVAVLGSKYLIITNPEESVKLFEGRGTQKK